MSGDEWHVKTDTGIYRRLARPLRNTEDFAAFAAEWNEIIAHWPERIERALHGIRPDSPIEALRCIIGDAAFAKMPPEVREGALRDAKEAAAVLRALKARFRDAEEQEAARLGVVLGAALERLGIRWAEPHAARGRKTVEAARAGHRMRYGTAEARARRDAYYRREVAAICQRNETISIWGACTLVAERHGVSAKTIYRATRRK